MISIMDPLEPDHWSLEIARLFNAARRTHSLTYGPWLTEKIEGHGIAAQAALNTYGLAPEAYRVCDLDKQTIVVCASQALASLIASLPDLCDTSLRPSSAATVVCELSGTVSEIPPVGTTDPQAAFDAGYQLGHTKGWSEGWSEAQPTGECYDCGDTAPKGLYQCAPCHTRATAANGAE